ncbi:hypothetical protein OSB04_011778 [Centaurea solstitialis]|uniref:Uncharacterized protein n=1 Tax=Centaurea solstitialis TaxID=347529 RepID=A0AA38WPG5_9ASTR|nr:hypothetical protein OSB04_011778 [Centaurea solstitialis]
MAENLPPPPTHSTSNLTLLSILSKDKLTVPNYLDWIRALRIALRYEDKEYLLDEDLPILDDEASPEAVDEYNKHDMESRKVACLMLASMSPKLRKSFENMEAFDISKQLREMFQEQARQAGFQVKIKAYIDMLGNLGVNFPREFAIDMVQNALSGGYKQFIVNFNMNNMDKTLMELHGMLRTAEASMGKTQSAHSPAPILAIREGGCKKKKVSHPKGKGKAKVVLHNQGLKRKAETSDISPTSDPKEAICFYCQETGHWKRSCPKYPEDLKMNKAKGCGTSDIFMIELHSTSVSNSWVLDTGCGAHICSNFQGLKKSRTLKHGELNLIMGNRMTLVVTKIGDLELVLSSATPCDGVYESVICVGRNNNNLTLNVGSSNSELNKSSLWHHRLGHINKKRIAKLQSDGILESFDLKSDEECESCLLGKMTKSPFKGKNGKGSAIRNGERYFCSKGFKNEVENQLGKKIKILRSDRGGEYLSHEFYDYLRDCGIVSQLSPRRTPQLNGVSKKRNRTLLDMVRSMMSRATLPMSFWGYALETTTHILNLPQHEVESPVEETNITPPPLRRTSRVSKVNQSPKYYYGFHITEEGDTLVNDNTFDSTDKPSNYKEAMAGPETAKWKEAMESEIQSMYDNHVWELVDHTPGHKTVGCNN